MPTRTPTSSLAGPLRIALLALAFAGPLGTGGCRKQPEPSVAAARPFAAQDVAAAAELDARLAALTLESSRYLDHLSHAEGAAARGLVSRIDAAVQAVVQAGERVTHPLDRPGADAVVASARRFASDLASFGAAFAQDPAAPAGALVQARDELGRAVNAYRQSRTAWRVDQPLEVGAAQDFSLARAELEKAEMAALEIVPVAPRDEGHKLDAGSVRLTAQAALVRARDAAARLEPEVRQTAARWVDAQDRSLQALLALQAAPPPEQSRLSLSYQAARAEALSALAELARRRAAPAAR